MVRGQKGNAMDTMYIITRIMQSDPFSFDGFRYFLDYAGSWIVRRARLRPDGGYDMSTAEYVCNFTL